MAVRPGFHHRLLLFLALLLGAPSLFLGDGAQDCCSAGGDDGKCDEHSVLVHAVITGEAGERQMEWIESGFVAVTDPPPWKIVITDLGNPDDPNDPPPLNPKLQDQQITPGTSYPLSYLHIPEEEAREDGYFDPSSVYYIYALGAHDGYVDIPLNPFGVEEYRPPRSAFCVRLGHKLHVDITYDGDIDLEIQPPPIWCHVKLTWGCSGDSFELDGPRSGDVVIDPSSVQACGRGTATVGSASFRLGVGARRDLVYYQAALSLASYDPARLSLPLVTLTEPPLEQFAAEPGSPNVLRKTYRAPDGGLIKILDGQGRILQVRSQEGLSVISELASGYGFQISCYHQSAGMAKGLYVPSGSPYVVWTFENPDAGVGVTLQSVRQGALPPQCAQLRITEFRGTLVKSTYFSYDPVGREWSLWDDESARLESRVQTSETSTDLQTGITTTVTTKTTSVFDRSLPPGSPAISVRTEVYDQDSHILRRTNGAGAEKEWTEYQYDGGIQIGLRRSDGYYEQYVTPNPGTETDAAHRTYSTTIRYIYSSWGDNPAPVRPLPSKLKTPAIESQNCRLRVETQHQTTAANLTVEEWVDGQYVGWSDTTPLVYGSAVNYAHSVATTVLNYDQNDPLPSAGQLKSVHGSDGSGTDYTYEFGTYDPLARNFTPGIGETLRSIAHQFAPNTPETWKGTTTDENGNDVLEETYYTSPGPGVLATRRASVYDTQGNLTDTFLQVAGGWRTTSHIEWDQATETGNKLREVDETGIETRFAYPAPGIEIATRSAVPATAELPAVPTLATTTVYDVEGRLAQQVITDGSVTRVHIWRYNTAGRLVQECTNEGATNYTYIAATSAENSATGLSIVETRPSGTATTTRHYLDGSTKSVTGPSVISQNFEYSIKDGVEVTKLTRGASTGANEISSIGKFNNGPKAFEWVQREGDITKGYTHYYYGSDWRLASIWQDQVEVQTIAGSVTTLHAAPDPDRRITLSKEYSAAGGKEWLVESDSRTGVTKTQVAGFAANVLVNKIHTSLSGAISTTTTSFDQTTHAVTTQTTFPGIANPSNLVERAGIIQAFQPVDGPAPIVITSNGFGNEVSRLDPRFPNVATTAQYDDSGRVIDISGPGHHATMTYYPPNAPAGAGKLKSRTVNGQTTYFSYESNGLIGHVWGASIPVWYEYDDAGRIVRMHTYRQEIADQGWFSDVWPEQSGPGDVSSWIYYSNSHLLKQKLDANGNGPLYMWNPDGNMKSRVWARQIDGKSLTTNYSYNRMGELMAVSYSDGTPSLGFARDANGRISQAGDWSGNHTMIYNLDGSCVSEDELPSDGLIKYSYNDSGKLVDVTFTHSLAGQSPIEATYGYSPADGKLLTVSSNGRTAQYTYDSNTSLLSRIATGPFLTSRISGEAGRLLSIATRRGGESGPIVCAVTYNYDDQGRRSIGLREDGAFWKFDYDRRGELIAGTKRYGDNALIGGGCLRLQL